MEKYNANSVSAKTILKAIAMIFALITLITMFTVQVKMGSDGSYKVENWTSFFGDQDTKGAWASFVGYILVIVAGVAGVASIFLGQNKALTLGAAALAVVGCVLIFLVKVFYFKSVQAVNPFASIEYYKLAGGPIVGGVFGALTGATLALSALVKDAE